MWSVGDSVDTITTSGWRRRSRIAGTNDVTPDTSDASSRAVEYFIVSTIVEFRCRCKINVAEVERWSMIVCSSLFCYCCLVHRPASGSMHRSLYRSGDVRWAIWIQTYQIPTYTVPAISQSLPRVNNWVDGRTPDRRICTSPSSIGSLPALHRHGGYRRHRHRHRHRPSPTTYLSTTGTHRQDAAITYTILSWIDFVPLMFSFQ